MHQVCEPLRAKSRKQAKQYYKHSITKAMEEKQSKGRPPKLNATFAFIPLKRFPFQSVRLCISYAGKRVYKTDSQFHWYDVDLNVFNADGTLKPNAEEILKESRPNHSVEDYTQESENLQHMRANAIGLANDIISRGAWHTMTSKKFSEVETLKRQYTAWLFEYDFNLGMANNGHPANAKLRPKMSRQVFEKMAAENYDKKLREYLGIKSK